ALQDRKHARKEATADAEERVANNKKVISNVENQIEEDSKFLADVKSKCEVMDKEWDQRQQTRNEEVSAIAKAFSIIKESAYDLVQERADVPRRKTPTFWSRFSLLQESSTSVTSQQLVDELLEAGRNYDLRLVTLAMRAKIDSFTDVKESIGNMMQSLKQEQSDEVKQRAFCTAQLTDNQKVVEEKNRTKQIQTADAMQMEAEIQNAASQASALQKDIDELLVQIKLASQNREKENHEFQTLIAEQREMKASLKQALSVLQGLYASQGGSLVQTELDQPEGLGYKRSSGGQGVLAMMQQLIKDSEAMVAEAMEADQTAQKSFEAFAAETNDAVKAKKDGIEKQNEQKAAQAVLLAETSDAKRLTSSEIQQLLTIKEQLHESCDFLLAQFGVRQKARGEEIEALKRAVSILSG
ncbi:unnamed protein product, partial [Effrenium voratum]